MTDFSFILFAIVVIYFGFGITLGSISITTLIENGYFNLPKDQRENLFKEFFMIAFLWITVFLPKKFKLVTIFLPKEIERSNNNGK